MKVAGSMGEYLDMVKASTENIEDMPKEPPISNADYHAHPAVSKSQLDQLAKSPAHYWAAYLDPNRVKPEPTPAMEIGSAFHKLILEPDTFTEEFFQTPEINKRTKAGKEEWAAFQAEHTGKTLLNLDQMTLLQKMKDSVMAHPAAKALLQMEGQAEQTFTWTDETTGEKCKCRPDWQTADLVVDLKTTQDASPLGFAKSVNNFRYHVQANWYLRGTPDAEQFLFIAVEKTPPFCCAVYVASPEMVAAGGRAADDNLTRLAECRKKDHWPSYSDTIQTLDLPRWNHD